MNTTILVSCLILAAPALKDPPKNVTAIVGEWIPESISLGGMLRKAPASVTHYEFTADGKWIIHREGSNGKSVARDYKVDPKASPTTIDAGNVAPAAAAPAKPMLGIYKIEGDTLTICFSVNLERPTSFESQEGARTMIMVLKRAKK